MYLYNISIYNIYIYNLYYTGAGEKDKIKPIGVLITDLTKFFDCVRMMSR